MTQVTFLEFPHWDLFKSKEIKQLSDAYKSYWNQILFLWNNFLISNNKDAQVHLTAKNAIIFISSILDFAAFDFEISQFFHFFWKNIWRARILKKNQKDSIIEQGNRPRNFPNH